ncbi:cytochrome c [Pseudomonas abieticivorans]|uniref:cytochrome c n=1 Tax=Pseudomonas abieticivorans TaxID=2931382 RepID=UPI0020BD8443|nr:cytochrome c [Pseudomonas sp. PIA16]
MMTAKDFVRPLCALLLTSLFSLAQAQDNPPSPAVTPVSATPTLEEQGRRLAIAGDCMACHTVPDSDKPFAGGYAINSPFGAIFSTNITPSKTAGIGLYTEAQFAGAVREGVRADGSHLYPAMPYTSYVHMNDADVAALYAYFMHSVKADDTPAPTTALAFPFNLRFSMIGWNLLFLDSRTAVRPQQTNTQLQRGEYLTNTLEHCGACHTPRNPLMAEIKGKELSGAMVGPWYAPNITSDTVSGIGGWSDDELLAYLREGHVKGKNQAAGGMAEAVQNSLQFLPTEDLHAIVAYLKSTPAVRNEGESKAAFDFGAPHSGEAELRGQGAYNAHDSLHSGQALYSGYCASCHQPNGAGSANQAYPSLYHNTATGLPISANLIAAILYGVDRTVDDHHVLMPRFDELSYVAQLDDQQVADIANYVLSNFGNAAHQVSAHDVMIARQGGEKPMLAVLQPFMLPAMIVAALIVLVLLAFFWRRRRA